MEQFRDFTTLDETDLAADRELTTSVLVEHLNLERQRRVRLQLVHVVAVLSGPVGVQVVFPALLSAESRRVVFAAWLGAAISALVAAASEWRTARRQARGMQALRRLSDGAKQRGSR